MFHVAPSDCCDAHSGGCLLCGGVYSCLLAVCICTWGEAFQHLTGTIAVTGEATGPIFRKNPRNAQKHTQTLARGARTTACAHPSFSPWQAPGPRRISCYFSPPCVPCSANAGHASPRASSSDALSQEQNTWEAPDKPLPIKRFKIPSRLVFFERDRWVSTTYHTSTPLQAGTNAFSDDPERSHL
jgi:hypothetical protein